jgi:GNAT superfamily N-acetyltransferase
LHNIRKVQPGDALALTTLMRGLGLFMRIANEPLEKTLAVITRHLELCLVDRSHSIYIAEDQVGELAGYIAVHWLPYLFLPGSEGFISELFILETDRGAGLGSRLLEAVKEEATERSCYRLSLLNSRQRESYQRKFYEKHGWEERPDMINFVYYMPVIEELP